jgi:hypothetical protein
MKKFIKLARAQKKYPKWQRGFLVGMSLKLELQKQEFIKAYMNTYGEMPSCYSNN